MHEAQKFYCIVIYIYIQLNDFFTCHMYLNDYIIIGNDDDTFGWHNVCITVV